ncbi:MULTISPECIES: hypothetical protein [unclassified Frondihabitans]|uniref:hypothetical protein n=1 Tax=unclassified Frondihabitans TaxID=2626248 RepID=UPI000F4E3942|nr:MULTISPECIES: hypothetical protein [unclassified Frondihabitans]RPE77892.1 hypothetical protein EDF37_0560 [Frondihabitans sp. PhB153]RPF08172.1 hypothetical protein EDF39_0561 [Frondihabitans sp. PhB161]
MIDREYGQADQVTRPEARNTLTALGSVEAHRIITGVARFEVKGVVNQSHDELTQHRVHTATARGSRMVRA